MTQRYYIIIGITLLVLTLIPISIYGGQESLQWNSYKEGFELGKQQEKDIFIYFHADWCVFCKKMEKETYTDQDVAEYLKQNFVLIKVDTQKEKKLSAAYFVRGLPMSWFLGPNGERITALPGYVPPGQFLIVLKFIKTEAYREMSFKDFMEKNRKQE